MSEKTFSNFVSGLRESEISRVHIVGNGEPTLHPHFEDYVNKVAESVKYLSLVTNGQWKKESISHSLLRAPVDLIIVSVDGSDKSTYEKSRPKGNFERLLYNLRQLKDLKVKLQSTSLINIRLMLRPSQEKIKKTLIKYWKHFGDVVTEQKVFKIESMDYEEDVYIPLHRNKGTYPKCTELFNNLSVHWNGDVLLCGALEFRKDVPKPLLGTINEHTPAQLWKMPLLRQYRRGQRYRELDKIPICRGCQGS